MNFFLTGGQRQESKFAILLLHRTIQKWPEHLPRYVAGDKGFDKGRIHRWLKSHHIKNAIAWTKGKCKNYRPNYFPKQIYRRRNAIERCIGKLKEKRAIATRFDKLSTTFAGEIWLCFIKQYLLALAEMELVNTA